MGVYIVDTPSDARAHGCLHCRHTILMQGPMGVYIVDTPYDARAHGCLHSNASQRPMGVYIPVHLHDSTLLIGHAERVVGGMLQQLLHLACEGGIFLEMLCACVCVCVCLCQKFSTIQQSNVSKCSHENACISSV